MADRRNIPTRVWCGPDSPPEGDTFSYSSVLNSIPPDENVYLKAWNISKRLATSLSGISLDLLEIAAYVYSADQSKPRGGKTFPQDGRNWYRQFELSIPVRHPQIWTKPEVAEKLVELLRFMADDDYQFIFRKLKGDWPRETYFRFDEGKPWFKPDSILLFSGGLDSLTGAVEELQDPNRKIILVSHCSVGKISKPQSDLVTELKSMFNAQDRLLHIPVWVNKDKGITKDANQRSRSFLYASLAFVIASMSGIREIKFYENGIVSSNLPISNQVVGARASRSTHPKTLRLMSELFSAILGKIFSVSNPFFGKTKSDIVKTLKDHNAEKLVPISRSCTRTMGSTLLHSHCGTCSQCVERRLAMLHNEMEEFDPEEMYSTNLFLGSLELREDRMMVADYIRHARLLEEIDLDSFFERFPDSYGLVSELNLSPDEGAYLVYDLHRRHGLQAAMVINSQIELHSDSIRRGQINPKSLLGMIVAKPGPMTRSNGPPKTFPTPEGAKWEDIEIEIISNESIRVRLGSLTRRYTGFDMGFTDNRRVDRLDQQWELLVMFAEKKGEISTHTVDFLPKAQKSVQLLNKTLRMFFRINSNPIGRYTKEHGWITKFQIADKSSGKS